jgi:hypothetical protein
MKVGRASSGSFAARSEPPIVLADKGGMYMGKKRPNEKKARAREANEFEHEDDPGSEGRYARNAEKAEAETGLKPVLRSDVSDDEKEALEEAWPIKGQHPLDSARARARSPQPGS